MRGERTLLVLLTGLGLLPMLVQLPSLVATILTAPLLLLVPAGVGNALAFGLSGRLPATLTKLQALLLAYFAGLLLIILVFVASERLNGANTAFMALNLPIGLLSVVGWLRLGAEYRLSREEIRRVAIVSAIALPLIVIRYVYSLSIYSEYPVTDLFQRSHFHGGAFEFARTFTLNPFVAASYIPFQQLFLGLLMRLTGADPLDSEWVWPIAFAPLQIGVVLCLMNRLVPNPRVALVGLAVALAQFGLSNPTNGSMAELVTILLLSILLPRQDDGTAPSVRGVELIGLVPGLLIALAVTKFPLPLAALLPLGVVLLGNVTRFPILSRAWPVVALVMIALPFHRGALLYVILAAAIPLALALIAFLRAHRPLHASRMALGVILFIMALIGIMGAKVLFFSSGGYDEFGLFGVFDLALTPITGKSLANVAIDGDLSPGVGARVALFEIARTISPLAVILMVVGVLLLLLKSLKARAMPYLPRTRGTQMLLDQTLIFFGLVALILTGFPFIHRAGFLAMLLASSALAMLISNGTLAVRRDRFVFALILLYPAALAFLIVVIAGERVEPYIQRALPLLLVLSALGLIAVGVVKLRKTRGSLPLVLSVVVAVAMEFAVSRSYFKSYAFQNQPPPLQGPLAAFDRVDLETAEKLLAHTAGDEILVSDPKTMTFLRARTGLYPLVASSNLDTLSPDARNSLQQALINASSSSTVKDLCQKLMTIAGAEASGIYNYGAARNWPSRSDGKTILTALGYNDRLVPSFDARIALEQKREAEAQIGLSKEEMVKETVFGRKFVLVFNRTTLDWVVKPDHLNYFPDRRELSKEALATLRLKFRDSLVFGRTFVAILECR